MNFREKLLEYAEIGAVLPASGVLKLFDSLSGDGGSERAVWVGTSVAAEITGKEPRELRRLALRWERMTSRGQTPSVRVCRKSASAESHFLFHEGDCWAFRRSEGAVRPVEEGPEGSKADAIADALFRKNFG